MTYPAETLKKSLKIARDRQDTSSSSHVFFQVLKLFNYCFAHSDTYSVKGLTEVKSGSPDRRTVTRPPALESASSCGIQHGPIISQKLEQMNMRRQEAIGWRSDVLTGLREKECTDKLWCCIFPQSQPQIAAAGQAASRTYTHEQARHRQTTKSTTPSAQPPVSPTHELEIAARLLLSQGSQPPPHTLCVCSAVSVTSLSGWLWPFLSACGRVPLRRCRR